MHEFSIASSIAESVLGFCDKEKVRRVLKIRLAIGELTLVEAEQLRFCFASITPETPLSDAALEIETVPAAVRCPACSYEGPPKYWDGALSVTPVATLECPKCGQAAVATQGHDCAIRAIKFVREEEPSDFEKAAL